MKRNIEPYDKAYFKGAIHMMTQWRLTVTVTLKYLINIDATVAKWKIHYTTVNLTASNHVLTELSHPKLGAIAPGATVTLLEKYFVDQWLVNYWVCCVQNILHHSPVDHEWAFPCRIMLLPTCSN